MDAMKAVPQDDPKDGKPRAQSSTRYPYFDLDSSVAVARAIHVDGGGTCDLNQLSSLLDYSSTTNGAFRMRVSSAKQFGLIEGKDKTGLKVTRRGMAILAPVSESDETGARIDAFMAVDLFKAVYKKFEGVSLPGEAGLRNLLSTEFGIVDKQVPTALRVMLDSATQAGLFRTAGRNRMVVPPGATFREQSPAEHEVPRHPQPAMTPNPNGASHGGGGSGGPGDIDPALLGLLRRLPPVGERLSKPRREALIEAFKATINFIYPEDEQDA